MPADELTPFERTLLRELADANQHPPAGLAIALDVDLSTVLDTVDSLADRGLLKREGFSTCRLTEQGWRYVEAELPQE